jgi:hypothetical protein
MLRFIASSAYFCVLRGGELFVVPLFEGNRLSFVELLSYSVRVVPVPMRWLRPFCVHVSLLLVMVATTAGTIVMS